MADEHRPLDPQPVEQRGQHLKRLLMHELGRALGAKTVGGPVTET